MQPEHHSITLPLPGTEGATHTLHYTQWGRADNPNVVMCVHGLTRNGRDFDFLAAELAKDFRVICPDVAGRGKSEWLADPAQYGYPLYVADMMGLVAALGLAQVRWVGTSMGGLIGMMLAASQPTLISRMVLNDVGPFVPKASLERIAEYVGRDTAFATRDEAEATLRAIMLPFGIADAAHWEHVFTHFLYQRDDGQWAYAYDPAIGDAFKEADGSPKPIDNVDLWAVWDAITCPMLVLRGAESDVLPADVAARMAEREDVALISYDGIGHAPALMSAKQIADVAAFIR